MIAALDRTALGNGLSLSHRGKRWDKNWWSKDIFFSPFLFPNRPVESERGKNQEPFGRFSSMRSAKPGACLSWSHSNEKAAEKPGLSRSPSSQGKPFSTLRSSWGLQFASRHQLLLPVAIPYPWGKSTSQFLGWSSNKMIFWPLWRLAKRQGLFGFRLK